MQETKEQQTLYDIAHARAGDKGNCSNISLVPFAADDYQLLQRYVTEERVLDWFRSKGATGVKRYELPLLPALNFVIDGVLEGGVNESLNLDGHGKSLSYLLLNMPIEMD